MSYLDEINQHACIAAGTAAVGVAVDRVTNQAYFVCESCGARFAPEVVE